MDNEVIVYGNSAQLISDVQDEAITNTFGKLARFSESIKDGLTDGVDYGLIPGTQTACLFLPGADKIKIAMGLTVDYEERSCVENWEEKGFFMYRFKAKIYHNGQLIATGMGAANTKEGKYERQNPFTLQETVLLIAKKRAYISGIREASGLSSIFTQDTLDDPNSTANKLRSDETRATKSGKVTAAQIKRFYAICGARKLAPAQVDELLTKYGYESAKDIEQTKYDEISEEVMRITPTTNEQEG